MKKNQFLWIYSRPSASSQKIRKLPHNSKRILVSQCNRVNWCQIQWGSTTGWANGNYLKKAGRKERWRKIASPPPRQKSQQHRGGGAGYRFLYNEPVEGVYSNNWSGKYITNAGYGTIDVAIKAEGKTVEFTGVLHLHCTNPNHSWKSGQNFGRAVRVDRMRDIAPNAMIARARKAFC